MTRLAALLPAALLASTLHAARAHADEDASTGGLIAAGIGMAVPTYLLGVAWHEGTHALAARAYGASLEEVRLLPSMYKGDFYFGLTRWKAPGLTHDQRAFILVAPKITDLVLFGAYATLLYTHALPDNEYGQLAFAVLATGAWVDFSKDVISFHPSNDLVKAHAFQGRTAEAQRWPYRLLHASLSIAGGFVLYQGYADIFDREPTTMPMLLPLASGRF